MTADQQALDAAIANLTTQVQANTDATQQLNTDWEALKAKLASGQPATDFTNEVNAVNAAIANLNAVQTQTATTDAEIKAE